MEKTNSFREEQSKVLALDNELEHMRLAIHQKDVLLRTMAGQLGKFKSSFGALVTQKPSSPHAERLPKHIETLKKAQVSKPNSPERGRSRSRSPRKFVEPSLVQRLQLARQRAATAELIPVTRNGLCVTPSHLTPRPTTVFSEIKPTFLMD